MSQRRRSRWLLRAAVLAALALPPLYLFLLAGGSDLRRARAELDATDPGWRLDDLLAAQQASLPPADRNALVLADELPPWGYLPAAQEWMKAHADHRTWLPPHDLNRLPGPAFAAAADAWCNTRAELDLARRICHTPTGGVVVTVPANAFDTRFVYLDTAGRAYQLLSFDTIVSAVFDDPDRAVESVRATLNVARAVDGPFPITTHFRLNFNGRAVRDLERVLALTEPRAGLPELQAALLADADAGAVAAGLRGGRAVADREFATLEDGTVGVRQALEWTGVGSSGPAVVVESVRYRPYLRVDHARTLRQYTAFLEVARKPTAEWAAGAKAVPTPPDDGKHLLSRHYHQMAMLLIKNSLHDQANLRTAAVGIACERFRQSHGRWPDALAELVPAYLSAVPTDPYDGQPLKLRRTADGLTIYTVGPDGTDDGGQFQGNGTATGQDIGFRLWDAARRRAAPQPGERSE